MIVLDTTVLVYAVGADHELRDPCRRLVERIDAGEVRATTTVEVIQEFCHVRSRRRGREDAADLGSAFSELLAPLLIIDAADLTEGLDLFRASPHLGAFDAVLASAAKRRDADALVSADRAFAEIPGLRWLDPTAIP